MRRNTRRLGPRASPGLPLRVTGWANLGELQTAAGEFEGALQSFRRVRDTGSGGMFAALVSILEATTLTRLGRRDTAVRTCAAALDAFTAVVGSDHPRTDDAREQCRKLGLLERAREDARDGK